MAYAKQTWANGASGGTPLSAARLNHIEDGIENVDVAVAAKADMAVVTHIPTVMASPPVVTVTNDSLSLGLTDKQNAPPGTSYTSIEAADRVSYLPLCVGAALPVIGTTNGGFAPFGVGWNTGSIGTPRVYHIDFVFTGATFAVLFHQISLQYRLMVDGQYVSRYPNSLGGTLNNYGSVKVDFPHRGVRHITVEVACGENTGSFLGIGFSVGDTVQATTMPDRRLVVVGDSHAAGSSYSSGIGTFVPYLARALGYRDFINAGAGGTGWLVNGSYTNIATRLTTDVIVHAPTDIIITLGANDYGQADAAITAQVVAVLASIRAALPTLRSLVVTGTTGQTQGFAAVNAAIEAGSGAADAFVNTFADPIFHAGNIGAFIGPDNIHETTAGGEYEGRELADRIASALPSIVV